jgi:class 3 adenylate cyclase
MAVKPATRRLVFFRSIIFKNVLLFLLILLVAVVPLALRYYHDSREYEMQNLASKLEFFAERGASWIDVESLLTLTRPEHKQTPAYQNLLSTLRRIEQEFDVDNAVVMRRQANGHYTYIAIGHNEFDIGEAVSIHGWFPATYQATNDTWLAGEMMHSRLFGGRVVDQDLIAPLASLCRLFEGLNETRVWHRVCSPPGDTRDFGQFMQINTPLKFNGEVVAILMLNKFAQPVATAVRTKTFVVFGLTVGTVVIGLTLFGFASARMLRPLKNLTLAAGAIARGNLDVAIPPPRSRDEVGRLNTTFASMLEGLRQRDFIRDTFGRYLSKEIVEEILGSPDGLKLGGEVREVTFLVSDLRGFTTLASHLSPHEVIDILNRYLERMIDIISRHRGTVDEFQGDGILAFFGAPLSAADDSERALACAIHMQLALDEINAEQCQRGLPELAMGIGINTGEVVVGNIGSDKRAKYGAVGSPINIAYRIESYTVGGQILISPSTYERLQSLVRVRDTLEANFKGLETPLILYEVAGLQGRYACALPEPTVEKLTPIDPPLPVDCFPVQGKTVSEHPIAGQLLSVGASTALLSLEQPVAEHTNLKLLFTSPDTTALPEVYAKVLQDSPPEADPCRHQTCIHFTALSQDTRAFLERRRVAAA